MRGVHDRSADRHRRTPSDSHPAARERRGRGRHRGARRGARRRRGGRRAARGDAGPRLARAPQRARRRPADRRRALRLARGDARALRPPARAQRLPVGGGRPRRSLRAAAVQHRARRGLALRGGDHLPPAGVPVRAAPGPRRPGPRAGRGAADRAALRADRAARRPVPGAVHVGHLHHGLPGERAEPRRRDARMGERRRDPGPRGALDPAAAAGPLAARGPARARAPR